jgi:hypothetical protein
MENIITYLKSPSGRIMACIWDETKPFSTSKIVTVYNKGISTESYISSDDKMEYEEMWAYANKWWQKTNRAEFETDCKTLHGLFLTKEIGDALELIMNSKETDAEISFKKKQIIFQKLKRLTLSIETHLNSAELSHLNKEDFVYQISELESISNLAAELDLAAKKAIYLIQNN